MTADTTDIVLAIGLLMEFAFVLIAGPRITRWMVKRDATHVFDEHMRPGVRAEVRDAITSLTAALRDELTALHNAVAAQVAGVKVPAPGDVAVAVKDALLQAQAQAMEGKPDPMQALRAAMREELDAAIVKLGEADPGPASVEDAAQVMAQRAVDARASYAAAEEQFLGALERVPGAGLAVLEMKELRPKTYREYARKGLRGAEQLGRDAAKLGIKLPPGLAVPGAPAATEVIGLL